MLRSIDLVIQCDQCGRVLPVEVSNWDGRGELLDAPELVEALAEREWSTDRRRGQHYCLGCTRQRVRESLEEAGGAEPVNPYGGGRPKKNGP